MRLIAAFCVGFLLQLWNILFCIDLLCPWILQSEFFIIFFQEMYTHWDSFAYSAGFTGVTIIPHMILCIDFLDLYFIFIYCFLFPIPLLLVLIYLFIFGFTTLTPWHMSSLTSWVTDRAWMFKCSECIYGVCISFYSLYWTLKYTEELQCIWLSYLILQPMLDVPIYGRIATLELFRPHVSYFCWKAVVLGKWSFSYFMLLLLYHFYLISCRVKRKIFYLLLQKDTNFVFFNGMQSHLSLSQGLDVKCTIHDSLST